MKLYDKVSLLILFFILTTCIITQIYFHTNHFANIATSLIYMLAPGLIALFAPHQTTLKSLQTWDKTNSYMSSPFLAATIIASLAFFLSFGIILTINQFSQNAIIIEFNLKIWAGISSYLFFLIVAGFFGSISMSYWCSYLWDTLKERPIRALYTVCIGWAFWCLPASLLVFSKLTIADIILAILQTSISAFVFIPLLLCYRERKGALLPAVIFLAATQATLGGLNALFSLNQIHNMSLFYWLCEMGLMIAYSKMLGLYSKSFWKQQPPTSLSSQN